MKMFMNGIAWFMVIMACSMFNACSRHEDSSNEGGAIKVTSKKNSNILYYSGTIAPIQSHVVTSPAEGVIIEMPFQFGERVTAGCKIFKISSEKFFTDYKNALLAFIKTKNEFNNSHMQLTEGKFLHDHELLSDDEFKLKESSFYVAQLALLQAKDALQDLMKQAHMSDINLKTLTIADIDKITNAMHLKNNSQHLTLIAPTSGVLLGPQKNEDESKKINKGDIVKGGDVLAVIGDMSGLTVKIKVNELTVNQIKPGQPVTVTGIAFPDFVLKGEVVRVDKQGEQSGGGMPNFAVEIAVKHLTAAEQQAIHVGMSAKIELKIEDEPAMLVPVQYVYDKDGHHFIDVMDPKTRGRQPKEVTTGKTTIDSVAILSGLNSGDTIVSPH